MLASSVNWLQLNWLWVIKAFDFLLVDYRRAGLREVAQESNELDAHGLLVRWSRCRWHWPSRLTGSASARRKKNARADQTSEAATCESILLVATCDNKHCFTRYVRYSRDSQAISITFRPEFSCDHPINTSRSNDHGLSSGMLAQTSCNFTY